MTTTTTIENLILTPNEEILLANLKERESHPTQILTRNEEKLLIHLKLWEAIDKFNFFGNDKCVIF